ncbi:hypothetical protein HDU90_008589 [Geranomyces variabilis]|nr:hypothetical protein HDU90_008589 [Geranomyces variabilis]
MVLDQTIEALTDRGLNNQRRVRQPHLLDELAQNLDFCKSQLVGFEFLGAARRLSVMEEVFTAVRATYRTNQAEPPAFFKIMEMTLDALTDSDEDESGQRRRRVREAVSPDATAAPFPAPRLSQSIPVDQEEEQNARHLSIGRDARFCK